jgi:Transposase DDE domain group 1
LLLARLRRSNIDASAGAVEAIVRIVARIRRRWPRVRIILRADSGFAREALMHWCETNGVDYVFGLARNQRLEEAIAKELSQAERRCAATAKAARLFRDFHYSTLDSWTRKRRVVGKAEHTPQGTNPRFVVTSLRRAAYEARTLYEDPLLRARRSRKPHRRAVRAVGRSRLLRHHGGQSAAPVVCSDRLHPGQCNASHRAARHPVCRCRGRPASSCSSSAPACAGFFSLSLQAARTSTSSRQPISPSSGRSAQPEAATRAVRIESAPARAATRGIG